MLNNSKMVQDRTILTITDQKEVVGHWFIEGYRFQWHWTTSNPGSYQGHSIIKRRISLKRYKSQTQLQWNT